MTEAPEIECPECEHTWHEDDYFEMGEGSCLECPECGAKLTIDAVEMHMHWSACTEAEYDERQRKMTEQIRKQTRRLYELQAAAGMDWAVEALARMNADEAAEK